ncbi:hypothetical protein SOCE26_086270 [Sorangium cellulosum]|uniref:Secreted protein n=1 Tax=Sorangium cellulosum TaxID=56 RepID=A0A2L0F6B6_SORCE|nr:hypothetical protein [Sorangium cellulosum]AUX47115.1 hypothetical protein SOCE26_086270 [Sorangium cellulosum]
MNTRPLVSFTSALLLLGVSGTASAQYGAPYGAPQGGSYGGQYGAPYGGYTYAPPQKKSQPRSTPLEVGYLYATSVAYGMGTGVWIDALAGIEDPGVQFIAPAVLGVAAPVGVYFLDKPPMPRGMPSAIATGMVIGAGEGLGIASYQYVTARKGKEWGFLGLATSEVIGSTVGGAAGWAFYELFRPRPQTNMFLASGAVWGALLGSEFGAAASSGGWTEANDSISLGGLIGFNVATAGAVGLSIAWTPSWNQLAWMWGGLGIGTVVSLPIYFAYIGSDHDPRRGLIAQGAAGALGIVAGALFLGRPDPSADVATTEPEDRGRPPFARVLGGGLVPYQGGMGACVLGELW